MVSECMFQILNWSTVFNLKKKKKALSWDHNFEWLNFELENEENMTKYSPSLNPCSFVSPFV